jgi:GNAT superfamily N-acetyltransferase
VTIREVPAGETALAWEALHELRPHLTDRDAFARRVDDLQRPEGYRIVAVFEPGVEQARAAAGFRIGHNLAWGRFLYVDDLSTLPAARRRGYGRALLDWCADEGRRLGCRELHLDSAVGPERQDAHRLYLNAGMRIGAHHFERPL